MKPREIGTHEKRIGTVAANEHGAWPTGPPGVGESGQFPDSRMMDPIRQSLPDPDPSGCGSKAFSVNPGQELFSDSVMTQSGLIKREEHQRVQDRIDAMYMDKLDGRIDGQFFVRKAAEFRSEQSDAIFSNTGGRPMAMCNDLKKGLTEDLRNPKAVLDALQDKKQRPNERTAPQLNASAPSADCWWTSAQLSPVSGALADYCETDSAT